MHSQERSYSFDENTLETVLPAFRVLYEVWGISAVEEQKSPPCLSKNRRDKGRRTLASKIRKKGRASPLKAAAGILD
jgi:hypothetical protein